MNSSKKRGFSLAMVFIVLAVYNVIVFVLPFVRGRMFWTGYVFSMAAIFLAVVVGFYALEREELRSKFYGWPLLSLVWRYLIIQLFIGLLEMSLSFIPFKYGIVLNFILLGSCLIGLIAVDIGKEEIEHIDERIKGKVFYIKLLQADVESMVGKVADEATKNALKDLAESIRYSDPMSNSQLSTIENELEVKVARLKEVDISNFAMIKSLCDELQQLIAERNRKCIILK